MMFDIKLIDPNKQDGDFDSKCLIFLENLVRNINAVLKDRFKCVSEYTMTSNYKTSVLVSSAWVCYRTRTLKLLLGNSVCKTICLQEFEIDTCDVENLLKDNLIFV